jgi:hypothetical protein
MNRETNDKEKQQPANTGYAAYFIPMIKIFLLVFVISIPLLTLGQIDLDTTNKPVTLDGQEVYVAVESMPKFLGGEKALEQFIQNNISNSLRKKDSKVFMSIIVDKYGFIREPQLLYGKNEAQIRETLRIIKIMPRWIPGRNHGKNVYVRLTVKFDFSPGK